LAKGSDIRAICYGTLSLFHFDSLDCTAFVPKLALRQAQLADSNRGIPSRQIAAQGECHRNRFIWLQLSVPRGTVAFPHISIG
jgi:hypothetical protein